MYRFENEMKIYIMKGNVMKSDTQTEDIIKRAVQSTKPRDVKF